MELPYEAASSWNGQDTDTSRRSRLGLEWRRDEPGRARENPPTETAGACAAQRAARAAAAASAQRPRRTTAGRLPALIARRARHRLRRHRHEPALRAQGVHHRRARRRARRATNVLGVLSLIVWSLTLVVTVKYLVFVMRADNHGEGGILALLALVPETLRGARPGRSAAIALLVIAGAALLYGDGMITPAISVLSARRGPRARRRTALKPYVVPDHVRDPRSASSSIQSRGTERRRPASSGR